LRTADAHGAQLALCGRSHLELVAVCVCVCVRVSVFRSLKPTPQHSSLDTPLPSLASFVARVEAFSFAAHCASAAPPSLSSAHAPSAAVWHVAAAARLRAKFAGRVASVFAAFGRSRRRCAQIAAPRQRMAASARFASA
jgi:hypothetical protein